MPYISTTPAKLRNPCTSEQNCTSPFSYKNVLSLTDKGEVFNELVGKQHISGNLDSPEGGFDAIMQVAVCGVSAFISYKGTLLVWIISVVLLSVRMEELTCLPNHASWSQRSTEFDPLNSFKLHRCFVKAYLIIMSPISAGQLLHFHRILKASMLTIWNSAAV